MRSLFFFTATLLSSISAISAQDASVESKVAKQDTIIDRIQPPEGFQRVTYEPGTFAYYLQHLPLLPEDSPVLLYTGELKDDQSIHYAVIDMSIGDRDLQQCADAIMRLRAEWLFSQGRANEIHFNLTNGFRTDFKTWSEGNRIKIEGRKASWVKSGKRGKTHEDLQKYLKMVFTYAGTLSLAKELKAKPITDMQVGDVLIQGGSPGHAEIVVDLAKNPQGDIVYLLAQSYMPAQSIHILRSFEAPRTPWHVLHVNDLSIPTLTWGFKNTDLKEW